MNNWNEKFIPFFSGYLYILIEFNTRHIRPRCANYRIVDFARIFEHLAVFFGWLATKPGTPYLIPVIPQKTRGGSKIQSDRFARE